METVWLEVFREVVRSESVTAAARTLGFTQSAVSRQIAALETEFGATLLDRLPRGVRPTDEGRFLLDHADAVLARLDQARRDLAAVRGLEAGRLRVGGFPTAGGSVVPRALAAFRAEHPGVSLGYTEERSGRLAALLRADDLDVAVLSAYDAERSAYDDLALRPLLDDQILVALPVTHRLARRRTLRLTDLADETWIAGNAVVEQTLISACLRQGLRPRIDLVVREWAAKQGFVAAGLGITLVPMLGVTGLRSDVVVRALRAEEAPVRRVYLATPAGGATRAAEEFAAYLGREARSWGAEMRKFARSPVDSGHEAQHEHRG